MKHRLLFLFLISLPLWSAGQGCITIFSEDGDKFYLVLNGIKQNSVAQTNVRVDGLDNEFYSSKIVFEDGSKQPISKSLPVKDPATGQFAEVTYKLKRAKDGQLKLRYFGATPVPVNYNPPPDMYVTHYVTETPATTVTQTTQTTTVTNGNTNGVNMNVGAGGVNMNINVNDPNSADHVNMNMSFGADPNARVSQHTTTTTTTTYSNTNSGAAPPPPPPPARNRCNYPMQAGSFNEAVTTIKGTSFEETKLSTAKSILSGNCLSTDQVVKICNLFSFEESKLDFAKAAYGRVTDRSNYFKVQNVFSFDASKTDLSDFISSQQ